MEKVEFAEKVKQSIYEQLATPSKLGLVSPDSTCAHVDGVYEEYLEAARMISSATYTFAIAAEHTASKPIAEAVKLFVNIGSPVEKELLDAFKGKNVLKGTLFVCALVTVAYFRIQSSEDVTPSKLSSCIAEIAGELKEPRDTRGAAVRESYGISGAIEEARSGYKTVFNLILPIYRGFIAKGLTKTETNQRVLLRLIATIDDTCVYARQASLAQDVKTIADYLCNHYDEQNIAAALSYFDRCSISTGGSGDMLILTILLAKLFPTNN